MSSTDDELRPWRVTATKQIVRDRWINLRADTCVTAAGAEITPYYVLQPDDWTHVIAVDAEQRAVMIRQYRHGIGREQLELPGGIIDPSDASPAAAAERELLEETGYGCGPLIAAGTFSPNPATHANRVHVFVARDARPVQAPAREPGETMRNELLPLTELEHCMLDGRLESAIQIAAVVLALAALKR